MTTLTGTWTLIRFILRRDRMRLAIWIFSIVGFFVLTAASFPGIYPTDEGRQGRAMLMDNPTTKAFRGPGHGLEEYTYGAMLAMELLGYAAIAVALMSIFMTIRHTRTEEEHGRLEMIRATVTGRYAPLVAALVVVAGANIAIAVLFSVLLPIVPGNYSVSGSIAFGFGLAGIGLVFAGVAAIGAQLSEFGRGASGFAVIVLGATYLIRAVGDATQGMLSWLSPIGWAQATRAFVDERWFPLGMLAALAAGLSIVGFALLGRRDVAAGILPPKPGPARLSAFASYPFGFALRQQVGTIIGWSVGLAVLGVAFGSLGGEIERFLVDNPQLTDYLAAGDVSLLESFLGLVMLVMALLASGFAIQSMLRCSVEEQEGRAEPVLATALSRPAWMGSYLAASLLGSLLIMLSGGLALGVTTAVAQGEGSLLVGTIGAAIGYTVVVWLLIGITAFLFGVAPGLLMIPWLVLVYGFLVGLFGAQLQFPGWAISLSPFEHAPDLLGGDVAILPLGLLIILAAIALGFGLIGFRGRDLRTA
jgi:ABC-2 type transport system permease protein